MGKKKKSNCLPIGPSVIELFFVSIYLPLSKIIFCYYNTNN